MFRCPREMRGASEGPRGSIGISNGSPGAVGLVESCMYMIQSIVATNQTNKQTTLESDLISKRFDLYQTSAIELVKMWKKIRQGPPPLFSGNA